MLHYKKKVALWPALYFMTIFGFGSQAALAEDQ